MSLTVDTKANGGANAPLHDGMPVSSSEMTVTNSSSGNTLVGLPLNGLGIGTLPNNPLPKSNRTWVPNPFDPREKARARTLVICFDGTGDQFDDDVRAPPFLAHYIGCISDQYIPEFQYRQIHVVP